MHNKLGSYINKDVWEYLWLYTHVLMHWSRRSQDQPDIVDKAGPEYTGGLRTPWTKHGVNCKTWAAVVPQLRFNVHLLDFFFSSWTNTRKIENLQYLSYVFLRTCPMARKKSCRTCIQAYRPTGMMKALVCPIFYTDVARQAFHVYISKSFLLLQGILMQINLFYVNQP